MTTSEIQEHIDAAIRANFTDYSSESGEIETGEGGDGRFVGTVTATRYSGLPIGSSIFLAIGKTEKGAQIVKFGKLECLKPVPMNLDVLLEQELGIKTDDE